MVYTRSEKSLASSLLSLSKIPLNFTRYILDNSYLAKTETEVSNVPSSKFWSLWSDWYHTFLAEATDENPSSPIADRRSDATSRWVYFASKTLRCPESSVRSWLRKADQKKLLLAYM